MISYLDSRKFVYPAILSLLFCPVMGIPTALFFFLLSVAINFRPNAAISFAILFNFITLFLGTRTYLILPKDLLIDKVILFFIYILFVIIIYLILKKKRDYFFLGLSIFSIFALFAYEKISIPIGKEIFYILSIFLIHNFFVLVKENDGWKHPVRFQDTLLMVNSIWNFPFFINYSHHEAHRHLRQTSEEILSSQRKAITLLVKVYPFYLISNVIFMAIKKQSITGISPLDVVSYVHKEFIFDEVTQALGYWAPQYRNLFAIVFSGVSLMIGLLYLFACSAAAGKAFGFDFPYRGFSFKLATSFRKFVGMFYYYYSKTLIEVFYFRIQNLIQKFSIEKRTEKFLMSYFIIGLGGMVSCFLSVTTGNLYNTSLREILVSMFKSLLYFNILALVVNLSKIAPDNKYSQNSFWGRTFTIFIYVIVLSYLFSLRRTLFIHKTIDEYIKILTSIFDIFSF